MPYVRACTENMVIFAFCLVVIEIGFNFWPLLKVFLADVDRIGDVRVRYLNGLFFVYQSIDDVFEFAFAE